MCRTKPPERQAAHLHRNQAWSKLSLAAHLRRPNTIIGEALRRLGDVSNQLNATRGQVTALISIDDQAGMRPHGIYNRAL